MPYGQPHSSGHGCRVTRYLWSPSWGTVQKRRSPHRKSRRNKTFRSAYTSLTRTTTRLLTMIAGEDWRETLSWALQGKPHSNGSISVMAFIWIVAICVNCTPFFILVLLRWMLSESSPIESQSKCIILSSSYESIKKRSYRRKTSVEGPPSPEAIREAWEAARTTLEGKLLAGTLLSNLEPVVDQSYIRGEDGTIIGRKAGIKGWLARQCPDMLPHYKALMSYKALADKLRLALGVEEPDTLSGVLDFGGMTDGKNADPASGNEDDGPKSLRVRKRLILIKSNESRVIDNLRDIQRAMVRKNAEAKSASMRGKGQKESINCGTSNYDTRQIWHSKYREDRPEYSKYGRGQMGRSNYDEGQMGRSMGGRGQMVSSKGSPAREAGMMATLDAVLRAWLGIIGTHRARRNAQAA